MSICRPVVRKLREKFLRRENIILLLNQADELVRRIKRNYRGLRRRGGGGNVSIDARGEQISTRNYRPLDDRGTSITDRRKRDFDKYVIAPGNVARSIISAPVPSVLSNKASLYFARVCRAESARIIIAAKDR